MDIPLGTCKQATMKMDSAISDLCELKEEACFNDDQKQMIQECVDILSLTEAKICNLVTECGHGDEFISEDIDMDTIEEDLSYESDGLDILDTPLE